MPDLYRTFYRLSAGLLKPVYNAALRLVGNPEDARQITQETFYRAWMRFRSGRRVRPFRPWLYEQFVEVYRERVRLAMPDWLANCESRAGGPDTLAADAGIAPWQAGGLVEQAMRELPEPLRLIFLLCDLEGFTYSQIAQILHCAPTAVVDQVYDARRTLRAQLCVWQARRPPIER